MAEVVNLLQTAMLTIFGRKKITPERVAHMFAHHMIETVESGFPDVAGFIKDSPEFVRVPEIGEEDFGKFLLIVLSANLGHIPQYFSDGLDKEIIAHVNAKLAPVFEMTTYQFEDRVKEYKDFMNRVNSPSKNTIYAMSKAVFFKYELNDCQDDYFSGMKTPNPIFLKNMDELMRNFLWDWEAFTDKYKVVSSTAV
jgi:hypothetical protein